MQEISPHVYMDTTFAGVTLGAINWTHGLVMIDSPLRPDDIRAWRSTLHTMNGGPERLLINLDAHYDRTLGTRGMESTVLAHEYTADVFRNRPVIFKAQGFETGSEWELYNGLGTIRWAIPDLTFSDTMILHWDEDALVLEHHPGPSGGAMWVVLPEQRVAFLGDAVMPGQPPFLAGADIPAWLAELERLLGPEWDGYQLVSGRAGLVGKQDIRQQMRQLEEIKAALENLASRGAEPEETSSLVERLMGKYNCPERLEAHYAQRLRWGLQQYYARYYRKLEIDVDA